MQLQGFRWSFRSCQKPAAVPTGMKMPRLDTRFRDLLVRRNRLDRWARENSAKWIKRSIRMIKCAAQIGNLNRPKRNVSHVFSACNRTDFVSVKFFLKIFFLVFEMSSMNTRKRVQVRCVQTMVPKK